MKPHHHAIVASAEAPSSRQRLFTRYAIAILVDLVVLNLFAEFWQHVTVDTFSTSLLVAVVLQLLLQATLSLEHWVGQKFADRVGAAWTTARVACAWLILFGSKFVMLGAIDRIFGDAVLFTGALHGVVALIMVLLAMLAAEEIFVRAYQRLH